MTNPADTRPVLDALVFDINEVSVLDVYPPGYMLPNRSHRLLRAYGLEGTVRKSEGQSMQLLIVREDEGWDTPVCVNPGQKVLFHGPGEFSVS